VTRLSKHQRVVIALSVHILRGAVARCGEVRVDTPEVRLALRCLLPYCPERWPLVLYWDAAGQENEIGRAQGVTAAFNGIVRQLRRAGCYDEVSLTIAVTPAPPPGSARGASPPGGPAAEIVPFTAPDRHSGRP
jgi:hypothetical protein